MIKTDEPKIDDEISEMFRDEMLPEWTKELTKLWTAFRKFPTPEELDLYRDLLGEIPLALLQRAVMRAIRDHKYASVPVVHDVWAALSKELGNPADINQAIDTWMEQSFRRCCFVLPAPKFAVRTVAVETEIPA